MKTIKTISLSVAAMMTVTSISYAADDTALADTIYYHAKNRNVQSMQALQRRGISVDTTDADGNTPLCKALMSKNRDAYNFLRDVGANPDHSCVQKLAQASNEISDTSVLKARDYTWTTAGIVGAVGLTAAVVAGSGGGGGGGGSGGGGGGGGGGGDVPPPGEPENKPIVWETSEYKDGGFLPHIAVLPVYDRNYVVIDGKLALNYKYNHDNLKGSVSVGIVDTGLYAGNPEFADKNITGKNFDYGPCNASNTMNCWAWVESEGVAKMGDADANIYSYAGFKNKAEYDAWAALYANDYNWNTSQGDFSPNKGLLSDSTKAGEYEHGTHISGIIAANRDGKGMMGVAFDNADLVIARWDFMSSLGNVMQYMADNGTKVVNMSFGAKSEDSFNASTLTEDNYKNAVGESILSALKIASKENMAIIMSAGNEGKSQPGIFNGLANIAEFADGGANSLDGLMITVVATGAQLPDGSIDYYKIADYSNKCGVAMNYCIAAPGTNIISTGASEDYLVGDGTSQATAVVTGSIALLKGAYPWLDIKDVVSLIFETAYDIKMPVFDAKGNVIGETGVGVDEIYGYGVLDLQAAASSVGEPEIATTSSVKGEKVSFAATNLSVTGAFKGALMKSMPKSITIFDKYNRPFALSTDGMLKSTHSGEKAFKDSVYALSNRRSIKRIDAGSNMSFGYAPSALSASGAGFGLVDVQHMGEKNKTRFYYAENTKLSANNYEDQALVNPFLSLNQAYGVQNTYNAGTKFSVTSGVAMGENGLYDGTSDYNDNSFDNQAYTFNNDVAYQATDTISVSALSGMLYEDGAMLGMNGEGGFNIDNTSTYYLGMGVAWRPYTKVSFSAAYYLGWTEAQNLSNLMKTSALNSESFAFDARYNMSKSDTLGFQLSSPLRVSKGSVDFNFPTGRDNYSDEVYRQKITASLKPDAREYKFAFYHVKEVDEALSFRSEMAVRLNPDHQKDVSNDYHAIFGLNWNF